MKRKIICAVTAVIIIALTVSIIRVNCLYRESLKPTQISGDVYYEGTGFRIVTTLSNMNIIKKCLEKPGKFLWYIIQYR